MLAGGAAAITAASTKLTARALALPSQLVCRTQNAWRSPSNNKFTVVVDILPGDKDGAIRRRIINYLLPSQLIAIEGCEDGPLDPPRTVDSVSEWQRRTAGQQLKTYAGDVLLWGQVVNGTALLKLSDGVQYCSDRDVKFDQSKENEIAAQKAISASLVSATIGALSTDCKLIKIRSDSIEQLITLSRKIHQIIEFDIKMNNVDTVNLWVSLGEVESEIMARKNGVKFFYENYHSIIAEARNEDQTVALLEGLDAFGGSHDFQWMNRGVVNDAGDLYNRLRDDPKASVSARAWAAWRANEIIRRGHDDDPVWLCHFYNGAFKDYEQGPVNFDTEAQLAFRAIEHCEDPARHDVSILYRMRAVDGLRDLLLDLSKHKDEITLSDQDVQFELAIQLIELAKIDKVADHGREARRILTDLRRYKDPSSTNSMNDLKSLDDKLKKMNM